MTLQASSARILFLIISPQTQKLPQAAHTLATPLCINKLSIPFAIWHRHLRDIDFVYFKNLVDFNLLGNDMQNISPTPFIGKSPQMHAGIFFLANKIGWFAVWHDLPFQSVWADLSNSLLSGTQMRLCRMETSPTPCTWGLWGIFAYGLGCIQHKKLVGKLR